MVKGWCDYLPNRDAWIAPAMFLLLGVVFVAFVLLVRLMAEISDSWNHPSYPVFKAQIEQVLPQGTDKNTVLEFLDQHQVSHSDMRLMSTDDKKTLSHDLSVFREDKLKDKLPEIQFVVMGNRTVAEWHSWTTCWAQTRFYFDRNAKLVGARIHEVCDGL